MTDKRWIIKSMDIHGFKPFADPKHIEFSRRMNMVVGAHKTGKTAFLQAIRWASLDRKAEKKSQNLIFRGSETLPASNLVEVSLTLADDSNTEIVLKRITRKNPDNTISDELFINGISASVDEVKNLIQNKSFYLIDSCSKDDFDSLTGDKQKQYIISTMEESIIQQAERFISITKDECDISTIPVVISRWNDERNGNIA